MLAGSAHKLEAASKEGCIMTVEPPASSPAGSTGNENGLSNSFEVVAKYLPTICALAILVLALWVAFNPGITFAPVPRIVLFTLVALLPAILFGVELAVRLNVQVAGATLIASGVAAFLFAFLFFLTYLAKPEMQVVVLYIVDQQNQRLQAEPVSVTTLTGGGYVVKTITDQDEIVLIFPEQATTTKLCIRTISGGPEYCGDITYAGTDELTRKIGTDLIAN
jgi:hypothetical protein